MAFFTLNRSTFLSHNIMVDAHNTLASTYVLDVTYLTYMSITPKFHILPSWLRIFILAFIIIYLKVSLSLLHYSHVLSLYLPHVYPDSPKEFNLFSLWWGRNFRTWLLQSPLLPRKTLNLRCNSMGMGIRVSVKAYHARILPKANLPSLRALHLQPLSCSRRCRPSPTQ